MQNENEEKTTKKRKMLRVKKGLRENLIENNIWLQKHSVGLVEGRDDEEKKTVKETPTNTLRITFE